MKLKTLVSAVTFFATLPCALLGLAGGEMVAQTLDADFGFGDVSVDLVVEYKGKSMFANSIKIVVGGKEGYSFVPAATCGWRPQIGTVCMGDGTTCLLLAVGDADLPCTQLFVYRLDGCQAQLVACNKILL